MLLIRKLSKAADKCSAQGYIEESLLVWFFFVFVWFLQLHRTKVTSENKPMHWQISNMNQESLSVLPISPSNVFFLITHFSALFSCNMSKLSTALKHWTVNKQLDFSLDIWSASKSLWGQFYINLKSDSVLLKRKRKQRVIESLMIRQSGGYLRWSHRCHHLFSLFS